MPKMRTIEQAAAELKAADPGTALTKNAIRQLLLSGTVPCVTVGNKRLVCMEQLEKYLYGEAAGA